MTDYYTPTNSSDDRLASFSAAGPAFEGLPKPDIVAPGGHMVGIRDHTDSIPLQHPSFSDGGKHFIMSGTSQAAGVFPAS